MEDAIEWFAALVSLAMVFVFIPILLRANGERPFVLGYLVFAILISIQSFIGVIEDDGYRDGIMRSLGALTLVGTLLWAGKKYQ